MLEHMIETCKGNGDVVVMGDLNAHLGREAGPRGWGDTTRNGQVIKTLCKQHSMEVIDLTSVWVGPEYTFQNSQGHTSCIDHYLVPVYWDHVVTSGQTREDVNNTSDHLPITMLIKLQQSITRHTTVRKETVAWNKVNKQQIHELYTVPLDVSLTDQGHTHTLGNSANNRAHIESCIENVKQQMQNTSNNLPKSKLQKHLKSYWNNQLSTLARQKKDAFNAWVNAGRPRDEGSKPWQDYKEAKRRFRQEQRRATGAEEQAFMDKISKASEMDQNMFWKLINKRRKPRDATVRPVADANGKTARDVDDILQTWQLYYNELYRLKDEPGYDADFKETVDRTVGEVDMTPRCDDTTLLDSPITVEEVKQACSELTCGTAAGYDGIQPEHLKYAGPKMLEYLAETFTLMTQEEWRPDSLRTGIIVPIPKGDKDPTLPENNRGITLMSVIGKTYDKILLKRSEDWFTSILDDQQGANRKHISSLHTALTVKETIAHNREQGKSVYVVMLDTKKAFDTVWLNGLFYKLKLKGLDPKLWRILKNTYDDFKCAVSIGGKLSGWFRPEQGVHQGDIFSMRLYGVHINQLLVELKESYYGARVQSIVIAGPTFADDITVIAVSKMALNQQLGICRRYSRKWRYQYHPNKTTGLAYGNDTHDKTPIKLGEHTVHTVTHSTHVGVPIYTNKKGESELVAQKASTCRKTFYMLEGIGKLNPMSASKLYRSICLPKLLYGCEVWQPSPESIEKMEKVHCEIGRKIQWLPDTCARPVCYSHLGWMSVDAYIDVARLMFLWNLISLPYWTIYNRLTIRAISKARVPHENVHDGPIAVLYDTALKYGLGEWVREMVDTGCIPSKQSWKKSVKQNVRSMYNHRWKMTCQMYSTLNATLLQLPNRADISVWWQLCKRNTSLRKMCSLMINMLTGNHSLNSGRGQYIVHTSLCQLCDSFQTESICHMLFQCEGLINTRNELFAKLTDVMPAAMARELQGMVDDNKTTFLLTGMNSDFIVPEWESTYVGILVFISGMYKQRKELTG